MISLSIVIPVYNEEQNISPLYGGVKKVCGTLGKKYEMIFIDDGSRDKSFDVLRGIASRDNTVKVISFRRNFGQTAALSAGFEEAKGNVIISMDADLQNDPIDIPSLLAVIEEGYDVASGWRKNRQDNLISRKVPSWIANKLISFITRVRLHDYGCTIKAYKSDILKDIKIYGEMHRFIPAYAVWRGARIKEISVNHHPRVFGKTKYGIFRTFKVLLDLLVVKFVIDYSTKSIYFFGGLGVISMVAGFFGGLLALYFRFFLHTPLISTPLPLLTVFLIMVGVQLTVMGLLSDIIMRSYYEANHRTVYSIRETINI